MVTLDEVKKYLRVDSSDEDDLIESLIQSADSLVRDVARLDGLEDCKDPIIRIVELYAVAYLYEHREEADHNDLTLTLRSLLFGVRKEVF